MAINRREALARISALFGGGWLASNALGQTPSSRQLTTAGAALASPPDGKPFTIAHITDVHMYSQNGAEKWFAECLQKIQSHESKPALIVNTGDSIMDSLLAERKQADALWALWSKVLKNDVSVPMRHCLGNHDYWGLGRATKEPALKEDEMFGAALAMHALGMERLYDSFDFGSWRIITLNSIDPALGEHPSGWMARLDDTQFEWLKQDLASTSADRPVIIFSHVPILQICTMQFRKPKEDGTYGWNINQMHGDARRLIDLFNKHPNVKLCVSGHMHLRDRIEMVDATYICAGAVSGNWWKGDRYRTEPGYSLITLHPDGKFDFNYTGYGWNDSAMEKKEG